MSCPKKNKSCTQCLIYKGRGKNFICSGINKKPDKYKHDNVQLCLSGELCSREIQMTKQEACFITSVLMATVGQIEPSIIKKQKEK